MTFSYEDLLSPEEILADALVAINDQEMKLFRKGWYLRQIRTGLETLNYKAPFVERHADMYISKDLSMPLPSGAWNIKDIFLYNGDDCTIQTSTRVLLKRNFIQGAGGYTARVKTGQIDLYSKTNVNDNSLFFYNVNNGRIVLSSSCAAFENIRVVFYGMPTDISQVKFIPPFLREVLISYTVERAFFSLKATENSYRLMWIDAKTDLYSELNRTEPSKWDNAIYAIKRIDKKAWDDISVYLNSLNY